MSAIIGWLSMAVLLVIALVILALPYLAVVLFAMKDGWKEHQRTVVRRARVRRGKWWADGKGLTEREVIQLGMSVRKRIRASGKR